MTTTEILTCVLQLVAGVGTFMFACEVLSENLEAISSNKLKSLFAKVSNNKLIGVCIGALTTVLIQSSSTTTVMVLGFVNAKIVSLYQAVTIILGGEIGTTITGQIVALGIGGKSNAVSISTVFAAFVGFGAFFNLIAKKDKQKKIGGIMIGFGMIFIGLTMMSSSMDKFAELESLKSFLASINSTGLLIVVGAIITAMIQSSSAMTSIAIAMIVSGLVNLEQGIYLTLGANVGTCITGALAAMTSSVNSKRASIFQLMFNIGGVLILYVIDSFVKITTKDNMSVSILFGNLFKDSPQTQLAMFHTFFNIISVIVALPITKQMADLTIKIRPDEDEIDTQEINYTHFHFFDEKMMKTPTIAVAQVKKEIINMSEIAMENFNISMNIIKTLDYSRKEEFENNEKELNFLNQYLVQVVAELSKKSISAHDASYLSTTYRAISDFERIGDYSENIIEYAQHLSNAKEKFSDKALKEIIEIEKLVNELYDDTINCYKSYNKKVFEHASDIEDKIDDLTNEMAENHIKRMNNGECNAHIGAQYLQLSSDVERIADHLININDKEFMYSH